MKRISMLTYLVIKVIIYAVFLTGLSACEKPHIGTRQLAIDLTKQLNDKVCPAGYIPAQPCNGKDVRFDADLGTVAYINIYGVTNEAEIETLTNFSAKFREERDKRIPVYLTFYSDLNKSNEFKHIKLKGD